MKTKKKEARSADYGRPGDKNTIQVWKDGDTMTWLSYFVFGL